MPAVLFYAAAVIFTLAECGLFLAPPAKVSRRGTVYGFLIGAAFTAVVGYMGAKLSLLLPEAALPYAGIIPVAASAVRAGKYLTKRVGFGLSGEIREENLIQLAAALTVRHSVCLLSLSVVPGEVSAASAAVFAVSAAGSAAALACLPPADRPGARKVFYLLTALSVQAAGVMSIFINFI